MGKGARLRRATFLVEYTSIMSQNGICLLADFLVQNTVSRAKSRTHLLGTFYVIGTGASEVSVTIVGRCRGCENWT